MAKKKKNAILLNIFGQKTPVIFKDLRQENILGCYNYKLKTIFLDTSYLENKNKEEMFDKLDNQFLLYSYSVFFNFKNAT